MKRTILAATLLLGFALLPATAQQRHSITTNDGAVISYWQAGTGKAIVMLPGWSQSADQFSGQLPLAEKFAVTAVDLRGHGESSKIKNGYHIHRLAMDVHELIESEGLEDVTLLGHSMGASVIWGYWELFGNEHVSKFVIADQTASCAYNPAWSESVKAETGGLWDYNALAATADQIQSETAVQFATDFVNDAFFTKAYPQDKKDYVTSENLKLPRPQAARLIFNHCTLDWRDVIKTIDIPVLIVGGEKSIFNVKALEWIRDAIPGAKLEVFREAEGGSHFMFMENPEKFNALVADFVSR